MSASRWYRVAVVAALAVGVAVVLGMHKPSGSTQESPQTGLPRLLELGSTTCVACQQMAPIIEALKKEYAGRLQVQFIDVYEDEAAARKHGVRVIPTQIFFDAQGREFFRHEGFFPKEEILAVFRRHGIELGGSAGKGGE